MILNHGTIRQGFDWPVIENANLRDGTVIVLDPVAAGDPLTAHRAVIVGTRPLTVLEQAAEEGRQIVREGMADVIEWLGLPDRRWRPGKEILADLRDLARR